MIFRCLPRIAIKVLLKSKLVMIWHTFEAIFISKPKKFADVLIYALAYRIGLPFTTETWYFCEEVVEDIYRLGQIFRWDHAFVEPEINKETRVFLHLQKKNYAVHYSFHFTSHKNRFDSSVHFKKSAGKIHVNHRELENHGPVNLVWRLGHTYYFTPSLHKII